MKWLLLCCLFVSCGKINYGKRCAEYKIVEVEDSIFIRKMPVSPYILRDNRLEAWRADIVVINKGKDSVILHEVYNFKGETTTKVSKLPSETFVVIDWFGQRGFYIKNKHGVIIDYFSHRDSRINECTKMNTEDIW